ncbi:MAG: DUF3795 domain-containing protein [Candidatus Edwardsbacteria bacterium]
MNYEEEKKRHISFCGSYCHTCDWFTGKIRKSFKISLEMLNEYGFKRLLEGKVDVENFKLGLQILANSGICSGCKAEVAKNPKKDRCKIRQCCFSKNLDLCNECPDFPCALLKSNPGVIKFHCVENLNEIKEKRIKHWIDKQWKNYIEDTQKENK